VLGGEAAEELGDVFVRVVGADRLLLNSGHLGHCVLADLLMLWPVPSLAFLGLKSLLLSLSAVRQKGEESKNSRSNLWSSA
jgi:hypothetical protein